MNSFLRFLAVGAVVGAGASTTVVAQTRAVSEGTRTQDVIDATGAGTDAAVVTSGVPDGIARIRGATFYLKSGRATRITREQRFAEGVTVGKNGEVMLQDGRKVRLTEGQMVTFGGEVREAPRNIQLPASISPPAASLGESKQ